MVSLDKQLCFSELQCPHLQKWRCKVDGRTHWVAWKSPAWWKVLSRCLFFVLSHVVWAPVSPSQGVIQEGGLIPLNRQGATSRWRKKHRLAGLSQGRHVSFTARDQSLCVLRHPFSQCFPPSTPSQQCYSGPTELAAEQKHIVHTWIFIEWINECKRIKIRPFFFFCTGRPKSLFILHL